MPEISDLEREIERFRRELLKRERSASSQMVRYYGASWKRIKREVESLTRKYYKALASGDASSEFWLYQLNRMGILRQQVEDELNRFAVYASNQVLKQEAEAMRAAARQAPELIQAAYGKLPPGVDLQFTRLPTDAVEKMIATFQANSPVRLRLIDLAGKGAQAVQDGLVNGIILGQGPAVIARTIRQALGGNLTKALVWARTETLRAYRKSTGDTYNANRDIVKGWTWRSARNERTCAACWAMDGQEFPLEEELDDHPNGRCFKVPVTKTWAELGFEGIPESVKPKPTGEDAFANLRKDQQLAVLGPAKFELYQSGEITLKDLVGRKWSQQWGSMRYEKSLKELGIDARKVNIDRDILQE